MLFVNRKYRKRNQTLPLSLCLSRRLCCVQDVQIEREKQIYNVTGGCTALTVVYLQGKLYVANAGDSRCEIAIKTRLPVAVFSIVFILQGSLFFSCICRAIIIRSNDIIPMSTEFTPESERQRLQFLVTNKETNKITTFKRDVINQTSKSPVTNMCPSRTFEFEPSSHFLPSAVQLNKYKKLSLELSFLWLIRARWVLFCSTFCELSRGVSSFVMKCPWQQFTDIMKLFVWHQLVSIKKLLFENKFFWLKVKDKESTGWK